MSMSSVSLRLNAFVAYTLHRRLGHVTPSTPPERSDQVGEIREDNELYRIILNLYSQYQAYQTTIHTYVNSRSFSYSSLWYAAFQRKIDKQLIRWDREGFGEGLQGCTGWGCT